MPPKLPEAFIFDIETGGLKPIKTDKVGASSIISASFSEGSLVREIFANPEPGSWLSEFSRQNIIPQLSKAQRVGTEKEVLQGLIGGLRAAPKGANLVGYNIVGFDIPFIRARARSHGLEREFLDATRGRNVVDVGIRTKMAVAEGVQDHLERGTFYEQLGQRTWSQAQTFFEAPGAIRTPEYNMLKQMESFAKNVEYRGPMAGMTDFARGWKQEQIFPLFDPTSKLAQSAHQSSADVQMTRRLYEAIAQGDLQKRVKDVDFAQGWLSSTVEGLLNAPSPAEKAAGDFYYPDLGARAKAHWRNIPKPARKLIGGAAALGAGLAAVSAVSSAFSGKDDEYNTIEGLSHKGVASAIRQRITDFGSGWRGYWKGAKKLYKSLDPDMQKLVKRDIALSIGIGLPVAGASYYGAYRLLSDPNTVEGMQHGGVAADIRRRSTDFSSPVDLAKAAARASEMYQGTLKQLFKQRGIDAGDITFSSTVAAQKSGKQELTLFAKSKEGKNLATLNRGFSDKGVDLSFVYVDPSLQGGFGKSLYKAEEDIFRQIGYEAGEEITSTVVSPLTARMQHQQYGSQIDIESLIHIEEPTAEVFYKKLLNKEIDMDDMPMVNMTGRLGYKPPSMTQHLQATPTRQGIKQRHTAQRVKQIESTPISGGDDAHNTIEGLRHGGLAQQIRKWLTPFGSGWDPLRKLLQKGEVFEDVLGSKGFRESLESAKEVGTLAEGQFGKAVKMQGTFRGKEFQFVRKTGDIGEFETATMRQFQDDFAPTVYGENVFRGQGHVDMELFQGKTFGTAEEAGALTQVHKTQLADQIQKMHGEGVVHGDIHWGNAMITENGKVGVIDFGTSGRVGTEIQEMRTTTGEIGIPQTLAGKTYFHRTPMADIENLAEMKMISSEGRAILDKTPVGGSGGTYMAGGVAATVAKDMVKSASIKTPVQRRGKLNQAASAAMSEAGRNGGRKSRIG